MPYATPADVAKASRGSTTYSTTEGVQWAVWIEMVEGNIARAFRRAGLDLESQVAAGDPTAADVKNVVVAAVVRKIQNPRWGETSRTVSHAIDDGSGSETSRSEGARAYGDPLSLLPSELDDLLPSISGGAFSVRPGFVPDCRSAYWP